MLFLILSTTLPLSCQDKNTWYNVPIRYPAFTILGGLAGVGAQVFKGSVKASLGNKWWTGIVVETGTQAAILAGAVGASTVIYLYETGVKKRNAGFIHRSFQDATDRVFAGFASGMVGQIACCTFYAIKERK